MLFIGVGPENHGFPCAFVYECLNASNDFIGFGSNPKIVDGFKRPHLKVYSFPGHDYRTMPTPSSMPESP